MTRVWTRVLLCVVCCWSISACASGDETNPEPTGDAVADGGASDVVEPDGSATDASVEAGTQDVASDAVEPTDGTSADMQLQDTASGDGAAADGASSEDAVVPEDGSASTDVVETGDSGETKDAKPTEDAVEPKECLDPNPAGCTQTLCPEDEVCDPSEGCKPSSCFCDPGTGEWSCSKDCGGGVCVPKVPEENLCPGPNPAGCLTTGCPEGYSCMSDPTICVPTSCACDEEEGTWLCSEDCGGGLCQKDEGVACEGMAPTSCLFGLCPVGMECDETIEGCFPSSCNCDADTGLWQCTADCNPGQCVPIQGDLPCLEPDPTSCTVVDCPEGFMCDETAQSCSPSSCTCDGDTGKWMCTKDCLPGICVPDKPVLKLCKLPNPESCVTAGCPDGKKCDDTQGCMPSSCWCDGTTGSWVCTKDCVPGVCIDAAPISECKTPNPAGCFSTGCPGSMECVQEGCAPSDCFCEEFDGAWGWVCTEDCGGGICVDKTGVACAPEEIETIDGCMDCDEALAAASAEAELNENSASGNCQADKDCVMVSASTDCFGMCPVAVNSIWAVKYVDKMNMVSESYCSGYQDKCPYATPGCLPAEPACVEGVCEAVPAGP